MEYPKMLYGPKGWDALDDCRLVFDAAQERDARNHGYRALDEKGEDDGMQEIRPEATEEVKPAPRRGRPRKVA